MNETTKDCHSKTRPFRSLKRTCLGIVVALFPWATVAAAPLDLSVSTDRQSATVGDPITVTIEIKRTLDNEVVPGPRPLKLGEFDVLSDTSYKDRWGEGDRVAYVRKLKVAAFQPGQFWIPSITGQIKDAAGQITDWQTDSLPIVITSVLALPDADTTDIAGLKEPYVAPESRWYWWAIAAAVALATVAYALVRKRRRAVEAPIAAPARPAWEIAMAELNRLRKEINPDADGGRIWYFRLSEILRRYWDRRFGWQSIDQTTSEIVRELPSAPFSSEHRQRTEEFLRVADYVRYARRAVKEGRAEVDWAWVRTFVNDTIPRVSIVPEEDKPVSEESQAA